MTWFKMMAPTSDGDTAKIELIGKIGRTWYEDGGVDLQEFIDKLKMFGNVSTIDVTVSSQGGSYVIGAAIYNLLVNHPAKIVTRIIGEASSAASLPVLAGDERYAPENVIALIHDPTMGVGGNYKSDELRKIADDQDVIKRAAMSIYTSRTNLSEQEVLDMMSNDTFLTGADMFEHGFVTHLDEPVEIAANAEASKLNYKMARVETENALMSKKISTLEKLISNLEDANKADEPGDAIDVITACDNAGFSMMSADMIKSKLSMTAVKDRIAEMKGVHEFCTAANIPPDAVIASVGKPAVEMARAAVAEALAAADVDIRANQPAVEQNERVIDTKKIYSNLNKHKLFRG